MIEIEKGIEMPAKKNKSKYPFAEMEIGDSFYTKGAGRKNQTLLAGAAYMWAKRKSNDKKFATREVGDGIRCWRTN